MRRFLLLIALLMAGKAAAQHTLGVTGGYGTATARFTPTQITEQVLHRFEGGLSWRYYGAQRFVSGVGIDAEFLQRGFAYAPYASGKEKADYTWYIRRVNSLVVPIVWQPHAYLFRRHARVFLDLAAFFSYNISSTYNNRYQAQLEKLDHNPYKGEYHWKLNRDNRFGYGLAFGGGVAVLAGRFEFSARVRYYLGYSDVLRNSAKYPSNATDLDSPYPYENPFAVTPTKSPMDNLTFSIGIAYRLSKRGFDEWERKPLRPRASQKDANQFEFKK